MRTPIVIDRSIKSDAVHLTTRLPPGQLIWEQCQLKAAASNVDAIR
jgi:hypothetical protein